MTKVLRRKKYDVALITPEGNQQHRIEVGPADQMVAESKGERLGVKLEERLRFTALSIYCALGRLGIYAGSDFQTFIDRDLYEWQAVDQDEEDEAVDPTHLADSTPSASPSPSGSGETLPGGSTPPATSGS